MSTKKTAQEIVEKAMPNCRVVKQDPPPVDAQHAEPDAVSPSLDALRKKYLGADAPQRGWDAYSDQANEEAEAVVVEPKNADLRQRGAGAKTVIVSKGKVVGKQG